MSTEKEDTPGANTAIGVGPNSRSNNTPTMSQPALLHTRTAPTTVPAAAVMGSTQRGSARASGGAPGLGSTHSRGVGEDGDDRSRGSQGSQASSATLHNEGVPRSMGGLHGAPLPGSHHAEHDEKDHNHYDHHAVSGGGRAHLVTRARQDLGLEPKPKSTSEHEHEHGNDEEGADTVHNLPPSPTTGTARRIERTATGTRVARHAPAGPGGEAVSGYGMVPVTRQASLPPGVGPFGGVAPSGEDAELGLRGVRSHQEELARQEKREKEGVDPWAVRFEPGEAANPKNWGENYRWGLTGIAGLLVLNSTFASSAPSGIITPLRAEFGFSQEVAVLTISLFVAGYCVGPLVWGPLSESIYGRRPIFIGTFITYTGFQIGCALSPNTASILVFRFLGGVFAAAPLTNSGALLADIWDGDHRGQAMSIFALAPFAGPSLGPIVSGALTVSGVDWRILFWITTGFAGFCLLVIVFCVPETYAPALLVHKARRLRKETGDERWYAPLERTETNFKQRLNDILLKPFIMLALEPMLLAVTLYMSFVYGLVYLLFEAFPFVFVINHGFTQLENGLAFLAFFLGGAICVLVFMLYVEPRYQRHAAKMAPLPPKPEKRLELCVVTAWCLAIAMFWFGWTSYPSIHWISPVLAAVLLGVGVLGMFVTLFNYIIDVYLWSAASALSATTVVRSAFGAGFPLFAGQMYERLGTQWASCLLAFLALAMAPIPLILMRFGPYLRARSKYSPNRPE